MTKIGSPGGPIKPSIPEFENKPDIAECERKHFPKKLRLNRAIPVVLLKPKGLWILKLN